MPEPFAASRTITITQSRQKGRAGLGIPRWDHLLLLRTRRAARQSAERGGLAFAARASTRRRFKIDSHDAPLPLLRRRTGYIVRPAQGGFSGPTLVVSDVGLGVDLYRDGHIERTCRS